MELQKNVNPNENMQIASLAKKLPKTIFKCLWVCLIGCIGLTAFAQGDLIRNTQNGISPNPVENDSSYVAQTLAPDWLATSFVNVAPTSINTASNAKIEDFSDYGVLLDLEKDYINQLLANQPDKLMLAIPVDNSNYFELRLSKIDITSNDFKITTSSGSTVQIDKAKELFYWGIVKNDPGSIAAVSFYEDEVRCIISDKDGNYVLGAYEDAHVLYADKDLKQQFNFDCHTTEEFFGTEINENTYGLLNQEMEDFVNAEPIEIYIECDYHMYQTFDNNMDSVKKYVMALFNEAAVLFANENVKIKLSDIYVWDTADPYITNGSVGGMLNQFNLLRAGEISQQLGILLTDRDTTSVKGSGYAWTGGLCTTLWSFAAVRITNTDSVAPVSAYSWDVYTFTHELGHLLGSPHTHACVWGPNENQALDNCNPLGTEGGCNPGPPPQNGGTIMSYCIYEAPFINFEKGFGDEPGTRIRKHIDNCFVNPESCSIHYNSDVFSENEWLEQFSEDENCYLTEIYKYGSYFHIKTVSGDFLYFNGDFLCEDLVSDETYCSGYYRQFFPELDASSCACIEPPPVCDPKPDCNTDPCAGDVEEVNNCECVVIEESVKGCTDKMDSNYNPGANCHDENQCEGVPPVPICNGNQIFSDFPWLRDIVDVNNCEGVTINVYDATSYYLIQVITSNSAVLYYQTGFEMCTYRENYICHEFYGVTEENIVDFCACGGCDNTGCTDQNACNYDDSACSDDGSCTYLSGCTDINACNFNPDACASDGSCTYSDSYTGTVFYDICDGGQNYYLIRLPDGTILDPYNGNGVNYDYPDGAIVEFGYVDRGDSPCSIADKAVTIECITETDPVACNITGTVFYDICDGGQNYYLILLPDGTVLDPYNSVGIDYNYPDGATVEFSYSEEFASSCENADIAVTITCINQIGGTCNYEKSGTVIHELCDNNIIYYLIKLSDGSIIDPYNANGVNFDYPEGAKVEFSDIPSTNTPCYKAEAAVEVICIREISDECDPDREIFDAYPFLDDLITEDNCSGISIRESDQFIIIEDADGQSLYLNTGVYFCDWESCIDFYLPDGAPCVWNCIDYTNKSENSSNLIQKKKAAQGIEVFPNPNNGKFSLKISNGLEDGNQTKIELYSLEGKLLKTLNYTDHFTTLDISEFGKGIYLLSIKSVNLNEVKKLIVN